MIVSRAVRAYCGGSRRTLRLPTDSRRRLRRSASQTGFQLVVAYRESWSPGRSLLSRAMCPAKLQPPLRLRFGLSEDRG
jgi:hypothetical protein